MDEPSGLDAGKELLRGAVDLGDGDHRLPRIALAIHGRTVLDEARAGRRQVDMLILALAADVPDLGLRLAASRGHQGRLVREAAADDRLFG
jgi:hypothetical protein